MRRGRRDHGRELGRDGASLRRGGRIGSTATCELIDLRTIAPWDRDAVLESVRRRAAASSCTRTRRRPGFGAEIAAVLAREAFWYLDAPIERLAVEDVPMPYHPVLLDAVLPDAERIAARIDVLLET